MPYEVLSHTADTGIEATAASLPHLVEELAAGMFGLFANLQPCGAGQRVAATVTAETVEELVVDALSELLYRSEADDTIFCRFEVTAGDGLELRITAEGMPAAEVVLIGPPIKAVTYHDLKIGETANGWRARVYFDV